MWSTIDLPNSGCIFEKLLRNPHIIYIWWLWNVYLGRQFLGIVCPIHLATGCVHAVKWHLTWCLAGSGTKCGLATELWLVTQHMGCNPLPNLHSCPTNSKDKVNYWQTIYRKLHYGKKERHQSNSAKSRKESQGWYKTRWKQKIEGK